MRYRTHRLRRVAAAAVLGAGMTAGVIGVTAGVAGASTTANKVTATAATHVASTGTAQAGANLKITFTHSGTTNITTVVLTVSSTGGTTVFSAAPVVTVHTGFSAATPTLTTTHHKVKVALTQTPTHTTEILTLKTVKLTTTTASGTVKIAVTAKNTTFTGSPVKDAVVSTLANKVSLVGTPTPVHPSASTQSGAGLKITFKYTKTTNIKTVALTVGATGGTVVFSAAPVVTSHPGFFSATTSLTVTDHARVLLSLTQTTPHTVETVTLKTVKLTTKTASGTVKIKVTSATSVAFATSPIKDAFVTISTRTKNTITATAATSIRETATARPGANLHVAFTHTVDATTLTLTASPTAGTVAFSTAPTVSVTGFTATTATVTATHTNVVKVALKQSATHTTEKVTFTNVKFTTKSATGHITVTPSSTPSVTFTPTSVTDANLAASVATPSTGNTITASTKTKVTATGSNGKAGNLVLKLKNTTALAQTTSVVSLTIAAHTGGTVDWYRAPTVAGHGLTATAATVVGNTLDLHVTEAAKTVGTVTLTTVRYTTTAAKGTIHVTPMWENAGHLLVGTFTPATAVNAYATTTTAATAPTTVSLVAVSSPHVGKTTGQPAGNWKETLTASSTATAAAKQGWSVTETATIVVNTPSDKNCTSFGSYVLLTGTPTVTVMTAKDVSATPTVKVSTSPTTTECKVTNHNVVTITFTNAGHFTAAGGSFTLVVSGVKYNVGTTTPSGSVYVNGLVRGATVVKASDAVAPSGPSNAVLATEHVTVTPVVSVPGGSYDAKISPVDVVETKAGAVSTGYVCLSLKQTATTTKNVWNPTTPATVKVTTGNGTVTAKVHYFTGATAETTATAASGAVFQVTAASTTASTYEVTGLSVNASTAAGTVTVVVTHESSDNCTSRTGTLGAALAYTIPTSFPRVYGSSADATAVKQLETRFPATATTTTTKTAAKVAKQESTGCVGNHPNATNDRPVILATTKTYQDTLGSAYLAGFLHTGTLLTPTTKLATVTLQALRTEGVTQVYVMGGNLAITTTIVSQLETTPAYACGGGSVLTTTSGATRFIHVTRIGGQTQYDTNAMVEERVPASQITAMSFVGAYAGVNATKGDGMYNDTAGTASTVPTTAAALKTAILANGAKEYQDAMAASALAYGTSIPIILTTTVKLSTQAKDEIQTLGIGQVIVMGGPLAISNTVVKSLTTTLHVSVLRIAGKNYTDTATELAKFEENTYGSLGRGWSGSTTSTAAKHTGDLHEFAVARGNGFTDGIAGADLTGFHHMPQLLTFSPTVVGTSLTAFLKAAGSSGKGVNTNPTSKLTSFTVFGGPLAVSTTVVKTMETDIG